MFLVFTEIDLNKEPQDLRLFLAFPNRKIIAELYEGYEKSQSIKLGALNEISFKLPFELDINHEFVRNPHIDQIKKRFLIKVQSGLKFEWYIIDEILDNTDDNSKEIHAFSLGYELSDKKIIRYECVSYNVTQVLHDALDKTIWTIGYIDSKFDVKYRSFNITSKTVLDFVYEIANTFGALVVFNTEDRTVNFYDLENYGLNKGLYLSYDKYLDNLNKIENLDNVKTRLRIFGKDGLSIHEVNITGQNYIEDFSYYMYPFERDENRNVLKHSAYNMSDELCHAILDYNELLASKQGEFQGYLTNKKSLQQTKTVKQNELTILQDELSIILDNIDIAQANNLPVSDLLTQKVQKESEIATKQTEINGINGQITSVTNSINSLSDSLKYENNFTPSQIIELNPYIIEEEWSDNNYIDAQDLYNDGVKRLNELKLGTPIIEVDIVNFLKIVTAQRDWDKLNIGDIITVQYEKFNVEIQAKIVEIDYQDDEIKLIISNIKDILNDKEKFLKMIQTSISTSTEVNMDKFKWNGADARVNNVEAILNNEWDAALRQIKAGTNESVDISRRGITLSDPNNPLESIRLMHNVIGCTLDGFNSLGVAISPKGVHAERLFGRIIAGQNLTIDASNTEGEKFFEVNETGVTLDGMSLEITGGLPKEQISQEYTDYIETQIEESNTAIEQLEINVNDMLSDLKITSLEANTLKVSLNSVIAESTDIINIANSLSITTEKTNYSNALSELQTELDKWIDKSNYPLSITINDRSNIIDCFKNVENKKSILINKIMVVREQNAKNASVGKGELINGVKIDVNDGLTITRSDNKVRSISNATDGFSIEKYESSQWNKKLYADIDGNLIIKGFMEIGSGNSIFKADSNGIYLGSSDFNYAPFKVNLSGYLTASNANIQGSIDCSSLKIAGTDVLTSLYQISGSAVQGSTIQNLNASNITTGKLSANLINTVGLKAQYIQDDVYANTMLHLNNNELIFSRDTSSNFMGIYLGSSNMQIHYRDANYMSIGLSGGQANVTPYGIWNFGSATVQNLSATAVFG